MKLLIAVALLALSSAFTSVSHYTRTSKLHSNPRGPFDREDFNPRDPPQRSFEIDQLKQNFDVEKIRESIPDVSSLLANADAIKDNLLSGQVGERGEAYVVAQFALIFLVIIGDIPFFGGLVNVLLGPVLMLGGLFVSMAGLTDLGASLSPWPVVNERTEFTSGGVFGYVRHPIYAGLIIACVGLSVATGSVFRLLLTAALCYVLEVKSDYEEQDLMQVFPEYCSYRDAVRGKFFPHDLLDALPFDKY